MFAQSNAAPTIARRGPTWWALLLIGILAALVYANTYRNDFTFDDIAVVKNNVHVLDLDWVGIWTDNYWPKTNGIIPDALYRPLTLWTYLANQVVTPDSGGAFHLVNVFIHSLVTILVSILTWRLIGNRWVAIVAGILFAVHPLHTEVIANTVGRAELLAALWAILALLVYLPQRPLIEETSPERRPFWHGILVAACFLAAILSKETPASLLLGFVIIDCWRAARWSGATRLERLRWFGSQTLRYYLPLAVVFGFYLWLRIRACGLMSDVRLTHQIVNPLVNATIGERIVTPFCLFAKYLQLTFWPAHLSADYSMPSFPPTSSVFQPLAALGILTCILCVVMSFRTWRRAPQIILTLGLLFTSYVLVANVIRIGTIFGERLFYWPSAFVLMLIAWALVLLFQWLYTSRHRVAMGMATLLLLAGIAGMCRVTWVRNTDWKNNLTLAVATGRDNPMSGKACSFAGTALLESNQPEFESFGLKLLERSVELSPDYVTPRWELAKYYGIRKEIGKSADAVAEAARLDPGTHATSVAISGVLEVLRISDPKDYMPVLENYQREHPTDEAAYFALALGYHAQRKFDLAETSARKALDLGKRKIPDGFDQFHEAATEMAAVQYERAEYSAAVDTMRKYAFHMRNSADAHCAFASLLMSVDLTKFPEALKEAELNLAIAYELDPSSALVRELRGRLSVKVSSVDRFAAASLKSLMTQLRHTGQGGQP